MDKKIYLSIIAALLTLALAAFVGRLMLPFAEPLAWALVIGIATHPHYERLVRFIPGKPDRSAGVMVAIITLCIILPATALIFAIAQNAVDLYHESQELFKSVGATGTSALSRLPFVDRVLGMADKAGVDITGHAANIAGTISQFLLNAATGAVKNVAQFILTLFMAVFVLFFVYRDGERIVDDGVRRFDNDGGQLRHYLSEIRATTTAVTVGTILTCLVQGAIAGVGYFFAALPAPILCGILTAIAALIPVVGTALVWVPLALYLAITGAYLKAGLLTVWCVFFVGISDNIIRPLTIGAKSNIPTLAIVIGAVGGAAVLGLLGLILGPVLLAILVTVWREMTGSRPTDTSNSPSGPAS